MTTMRCPTTNLALSPRLRVLILLWIALAFILAALPSQAKSDDRLAAARQVIESQIEAFRRDDAAGAYAFAAPSIQAMFPTAERFMTMVRRGYAPVYRPTAYSFDMAKWRSYADVIQPVRIEWSGGAPVIAVYRLAHQPSGEWKIAGVFLARDDRIRT